MLRAFSTRRSRRGYDRLADEASAGVVEAKLSRVTSLPAKLFSSSKKLAPEKNFSFPTKDQAKQVKKVGKIHPIFSLFESRRRKKATAKPEFARYMEYVKEGGLWDVNSNGPVIYYK